jgi:hypothetical protein
MKINNSKFKNTCKCTMIERCIYCKSKDNKNLSIKKDEKLVEAISVFMGR